MSAPARYARGQSCVQRGEAHAFAPVEGRSYSRCPKCGSTKTDPKARALALSASLSQSRQAGAALVVDTQLLAGVAPGLPLALQGSGARLCSKCGSTHTFNRTGVCDACAAPAPAGEGLREGEPAPRADPAGLAPVALRRLRQAGKFAEAGRLQAELLAAGTDAEAAAAVERFMAMAKRPLEWTPVAKRVMLEIERDTEAGAWVWSGGTAGDPDELQAAMDLAEAGLVALAKANGGRTYTAVVTRAGRDAARKLLGRGR